MQCFAVAPVLPATEPRRRVAFRWKSKSDCRAAGNATTSATVMWSLAACLPSLVVAALVSHIVLVAMRMRAWTFGVCCVALSIFHGETVASRLCDELHGRHRTRTVGQKLFHGESPHAPAVMAEAPAPHPGLRHGASALAVEMFCRSLM